MTSIKIPNYLCPDFLKWNFACHLIVYITSMTSEDQSCFHSIFFTYFPPCGSPPYGCCRCLLWWWTIPRCPFYSSLVKLFSPVLKVITKTFLDFLTFFTVLIIKAEIFNVGLPGPSYYPGHKVTKGETARQLWEMNAESLDPNAGPRPPGLPLWWIG